MADDDKTRTGAELLLDVEQKIDLLLGYIRNLDNTQKIMLQRLNVLQLERPAEPVNDEAQRVILQELAEIKEQAAKPPVIFPAPTSKPTHMAEPQPVPGQFARFENMPKTNHFEQMKAAAGVVDADEPQPDRVAIKAHPEQPRLPSAQEDELEEEYLHKGTRRGVRVQAKPTGKVNVSQQIFYSTGKPVVVASVEVLDSRGLLVNQTRTNQAGRWAMPLHPGPYTVHVVKRVAPDSMAQPLEIRYEVDITGEQERMELPAPEIE